MATRFPHLCGLLSILLFLEVANICQGRIGDTLEEAVQRYGKVELQAVYSESKFLVITTAGYLKRLEEAAKEKKRAAEENKQKRSPISQKHQTARKKEIHSFCQEKLFCISGTRRL